MSARRVWAAIGVGALGAHLLTHAPDAGATPAARGAAPSPAPRPTRVDAGGGAVAWLVESHELPIVDVSVSFRSGSALDPDAKLGITRMMTRMLRRGARGWGSDKIEEAIDRFGGEISLDVSASTINVHLQVIRRNLEPFMKLVTELIVRPTFPQDELGRLQRETLAEIIEARDHDSTLARRFFRKSLFGSHPYGRGSTGTSATVPAITRDDVVGAHTTHVRRGNVVLGVAGDVTADDVRKYILPLVEAMPPGGTVADPSGDPAVPKGRRLVLVDKPARTQTQILIGGLGTHAHDPDHIPLHVANTVFGGTFTARLMREVRSKRGWSYGAYSRLPIDRKRESFSLWTFPSAADAAACIALELELLEQLVKDGITDEELTFARSYLGESYAFDVDTPYKRVRQAVDEDLFALPDDYHTGYVAHVQAVTRAQANAALRARISLDDLTVVVLGTASELREAMVKAIPRLASTEVVAFDRE